MVSPPDKSSNDVLVDTGRIHLSADGSGLPPAVLFASVGSFEDPAGGSNSIDYLSRRTLTPGRPGWATHPLTPPQAALGGFESAFGLEPLYTATSDDLTRGIFRSYSSLPGTPDAVADLRNLYLRDDLRDPGGGSFQLLTGCAFACSMSQDFERTRFVGASADFGRILIATHNPLTEDAPFEGEAGLFKLVAGEIHNVGYIPVSAARTCTGIAPGCERAHHAIPAYDTGETYAPHALSADGRRAFFTVGISNIGNGSLYVRDDEDTPEVADDITIKLNSSERSLAASPSPATYRDESANGTRAFFTSEESLTDDAPADGGPKLYMWTLDADDQGHHLTYLSADEEPADQLAGVHGTLGVSEDGAYVYFVQSGQIVPGEPLLDSTAGIYVWHQGDGVRYIGQMSDPADVRGDLSAPDRFLEEGGDRNQHLVQIGARVSPNGRSLLVSLRQPPQAGGPDHGDCPDDGGTSISGEIGCRQLYLYDAGSGDDPRCVSCPEAGTSPSNPAFFGARHRFGFTVTTRHQNQPLSDDGRFVFFSTGERLAHADINGAVDAYVFDAANGEQRLISSGESSSPSYFVEASSSGHDVLFVTGERLSAWDIDANMDIYDARVDGGVPEPPLKNDSDCTGDACQPPPSALDPLGTDGVSRSARNRHRKSGGACRKHRQKPRRRGSHNKGRCRGDRQARIAANWKEER